MSHVPAPRAGTAGLAKTASSERSPGSSSAAARSVDFGIGNQAMQAQIVASAAARMGIATHSLRVEREVTRGITGALGARAAASGDRVVLGPQAIDVSLAHELIHVAQAQRFGLATGAAVSARDDPSEREARRLAPRLLSGTGPLEVREPPSAQWQNEEPTVVIVPVGGVAEPLAAYAGLRERLDRADWNALNAAARRRAQTIASGAPPPDANEVVKTELSVPVDDLFNPKVTQSRAAGGDQWLRDLYAMVESGAMAGMSPRIQDEILYRWLATNTDVMRENVTIALVDPEAKAGGAGNVLTFSLRGRPVATTDGLLTLAAVDNAIGGSIEQTVAEMGSDLNVLSATIETAETAKAMLAAAREITGRGHDQVAAQALDQIAAAMRQGVGDLGSVRGSPFSELIQPTLAELSAFVDEDFAAYSKADVEWRATHPREKSAYEKSVSGLEGTLEAQEKMMKGSVSDRMLSGYVGMGAYYQAQAIGAQNLLLGGAPEQERQLGLAYEQGLISYASWSEGVAKAERRGYIFGAVTAALTIATLGLGLYIAPATLGGVALYGAASGALLATAPMVVSNLYTSSVDFADPMLQKWWKSGAYSGRDIALAGLLGAGIGAALPIAGRVLGGLQGQGAQAIAALEAGASLPEGVVARTVSKGIVELTIASEQVTIRVTQHGYQVIGRAGSNALVVLEEGVWPAELMEQGGLGAGSRFDIAHSRFPTSVAFGQRGWLMISPQSSMPAQFGLWPELALPPGVAAEPAATASPLLLDAASGTPVSAVAGTDQALVLAGANIPRGLPLAAPPLMLGAGPTPFGYLPQPVPTFGYVAPWVPEAFEQSVTSQWGAQVAQRGGAMLPYVGEGAVWLRLPSGEWAPAYYPTRPGGIPSTSLITYGVDRPAFLVDAPGASRSAFVPPRLGGSYPGPRVFPMPTSAMYDPLTGMTHGRGHMVPHQATPTQGPGQTLSTVDPRNFVAHPRKYNEWIRNQLEQMLKREGATYTAHDVIGPNARVTTGGYIIPEAEIWVQYGPNGAPVRAWRFPLAANPSYYETLTGSFKDVIGQFEIKLAEVPVTPIRK